MHQTLFPDDGGHFSGKGFFADFPCLNFYQCLKSLIFHMDVRQRMIVVLHANNDAEEDS